jgi:hypothetical protein
MALDRLSRASRARAFRVKPQPSGGYDAQIAPIVGVALWRVLWF